MILQVLIPTFNRRVDLEKNVIYLADEIKRCNLSKLVSIVISDNASEDGTFNMISSLLRNYEGEITIEVLQNSQNVGLEQNVVNLLNYASSQYILWLGDDDILAEGYLAFVVSKFQQGNIGWIIPGITSLIEGGKRILSRQENFEYREFSTGYKTAYSLSHLGHQLSGLAMRREWLSEKYLAHPEWRNLYPFIFFLTYNQFRSPGIYAPGYATLVNVLNEKDWKYNAIGLLDHVFNSYNYLISMIGVKKLALLQIRFLIMHSYRIDFSSGYLNLIRQWRLLINTNNYIFKYRWRLLFVMSKEHLSKLVRN